MAARWEIRGEVSIIRSNGTYPTKVFLLLPTGLQAHGQSFRIRQSSASVHAALSPPASCIACRHPRISCCSGCVFGRHAIWREISSRRFFRRAGRAGGVWLAFIFLMSLITADNFLWRIASWTASFTFVGVTGDLRRDIFRHLTGHAPSYFSDRLPGMLTSRITATSNAVFTVENMFVWNVLPPCIATVAAIALIGTVSPADGGGVDRGRRRDGGCDVSSGRRRQAVHDDSPTRPPPSTAKWWT